MSWRIRHNSYHWQGRQDSFEGIAGAVSCTSFEALHPARHLAAFSIQLHLLQGPPITRRQLDAASWLLTRRELCDVMNERAAAGLCGNPQCTRTVDGTLRIIYEATAGSSRFCSEGCEERGRAANFCFPLEQRGRGVEWGGAWSRDDLTAIVTAVTTPDGDGACTDRGAAASISGSGPAESGSATSGSVVLGSAGPQCVSEGSPSSARGEAAALLSARLQSAAARLWTAGMAGASGVAGAGGAGGKGGGGTTSAGGFLGLVLMGGAGGEEGMEGMEGMVGMQGTEGMEGMEGMEGGEDGDEDGDEEWQSGNAESLRGVRGKREGGRGQWTASTSAAPLEGTLPAPACTHPQEIEPWRLSPASNGFNWACREAAGAPQGIASAGSSSGGSNGCGGSSGAPATSARACGARSCGSGQEPREGSSSRGTREGSSACGGPRDTSTELGSASGLWSNDCSTCASQQGLGEDSKEASRWSGGVSAAFWEALLCERRDARGDASSRCAGSDVDDLCHCSGAVGEAAGLERRREGQGKEEEQGCDEMAEQAEGEDAGKQGSEDEGGREEGASVEAVGVEGVGGEAVWQRLMAHRPTLPARQERAASGSASQCVVGGCTGEGSHRGASVLQAR
ncbi:unnamed protein product [Closterium sp. NIES-65]|nr:unnamed protein product [Closterium sp. NIES-65]